MENSKHIERAYELIEQHNFAELSGSDKLTVLSVMTEREYSEMRKTIDSLKLDFESDIEPEINIPEIRQPNTDSKIRKFLNYPIKFYQVAATIAIIISAFFMLLLSNRDSNDQMIAKNDTEIIQEKVEYFQSDDSNSKSNFSNSLTPNEMEDLIAMNSRNTIKNDTTTKSLLLALN